MQVEVTKLILLKRYLKESMAVMQKRLKSKENMEMAYSPRNRTPGIIEMILVFSPL
jgi:hypothetical protein